MGARCWAAVPTCNAGRAVGMIENREIGLIGPVGLIGPISPIDRAGALLMRTLLLALSGLVLTAVPLAAQERVVLNERWPGGIQAIRHAPDGSRFAVCFDADLSVRVYPSAGGRPVIIPHAHDA